MTLRAAAYHETVSAKALEEISSAAHGDLFGCSNAVKCPKCKAPFILFFPAKDDTANDNYQTTVTKMIENDCQKGKHSAVYRYTTTP